MDLRLKLKLAIGDQVAVNKVSSRQAKRGRVKSTGEKKENCGHSGTWSGAHLRCALVVHFVNRKICACRLASNYTRKNIHANEECSQGAVSCHATWTTI